MRYFVAGNLWALVALILVLGRQRVPSLSGRYSFFGVGNWLSSSEYALLVLLALALSIGFFVVDRTRRAR